MPTAVLVDGGFFLKRHRVTFGHLSSPAEVAKHLMKMCQDHLKKLNDFGEEDKSSRRASFDLYRIFYYDCKPFDKRQHNPVSGKCIDFGKTDVAVFQNAFHAELRKKRKVALRMGHLTKGGGWIIASSVTKDLLEGKMALEALSEKDVYFSLTQKGVDIKIGLDIASLAYKKLVDKIVLISGDSDFVPAAKLARREGIDFILDPMWNPIDERLFEHIDGLHSTCPRPKRQA